MIYPVDSIIQLLNNQGLQTKIAAGRLVGNQNYKGRQFRLALSSYKEILPVASESYVDISKTLVEMFRYLKARDSLLFPLLSSREWSSNSASLIQLLHPNKKLS